MKWFFEFYGLVAFISFFVLLESGPNSNGEEAFFKSLLWPIVACSHVEACNNIISNNSTDITE